MPIHISGYLYEWKAAIRILKLYIIPEHNQADKKRNVETLNLANAIKAQKILLKTLRRRNIFPFQKQDVC